MPPPALTDRVLAWQAHLGHIITAPHVTLLAPAALPEPRWRDVAAQVAERQPPVEVEVGGAGGFGDRVIFLKIRAPGLRALHRDLVDTLGEVPGAFALEQYHPHLTLALGWRPLSGSWNAAVRSAEAEFGSLDTAPLMFKARALVLFGKAAPGQPYTERRRFALAQAL